MSEGLRSGEVELDLDDLRALTRITTSPPVRIARIAGPVLLVVSVATFVLSRLLGTPYSLLDFLWVVGAAALLILFGSVRQRAYLSRWQLRRSPGYGPMSYGVGDDGFTVVTSKACSLIVWSAIPKIEESDQRLFMFVTNTSAYIIPRRAFSSDAEFDAFAQATQQHGRDHRPKPAT